MSLDVYLYEPAPCPHCGKDVASPHLVYRANITHNVNRIAMEAGVYQAIWRPDELALTCAEQLVPHLEQGVATLESDPAKFSALNPPNNWGSYQGLVTWVKAYLAACREYPGAIVEVCR